VDTQIWNELPPALGFGRQIPPLLQDTALSAWQATKVGVQVGSTSTVVPADGVHAPEGVDVMVTKVLPAPVVQLLLNCVHTLLRWPDAHPFVVVPQAEPVEMLATG